MKLIKFLFLFIIVILTNGCVQSTAMIGPAITLTSTGNIYQAGANFGANKAVENETGMTTSELVASQIQNNKKLVTNTELEKSLLILVDLNIEKTRKIIDKKN